MISSYRFKLYETLGFLLLANFILRFIFEMHLHAVPFYFDQLKINLQETSWYTYMIPSNAKAWGGTFASFSIGILPILNQLIGNSAAYLLLNALFIVTAYTLSWAAFRSRVLTFTVGLCTAFTTLNDHVYDNGSLVALYIPLIFCMLNLFASLKLFQEEKPKRRWWYLWVFSLIFYILSFEGWIDYFACFVLIFPALFFLLRKNKNRLYMKRMMRLMSIMVFFFMLFLYIKLTFTYASNKGDEHDLIFNYGYHYWLLILEDFIANFLTFFYTTIITYLPPQLTFSNSLMKYGPQTIIDLQNGYDLPYVQIAAMNAVVLWRFYAGILFAIFSYYFWQVGKRLFTTLNVTAHPWKRDIGICIECEQLPLNKDYLFIFIFMFMVLMGAPAHMLVKFRGFHLVPWLSYQSFIGQIGLILLISYGLFMLHNSSKRPFFIWTISILVWSSIIISAFTKHPFYQAGRAYGYVLQYYTPNKSTT